MRFAYALFLISGCDVLDPCGGPEYLNFATVRHGMLPSGSPTLDSQAPLWGATEPMKSSDQIDIIFAQHHSLSPDVLELYAGDGTRVAFAGEDVFVPTNTEACAHNERHYSLTSLAPGDYTLVHRRKHGTGDPLNCLNLDCPWTTFDGDQAVKLTLSIQ